MTTTDDAAPRSRIRRALGFAFRWAHPSREGIPGLDADSAHAQCEEISKTIWSLTSLLVGACLFCILILGAPDASLVSADAKVSVPIASLTVSYGDFLLFGPLFLIGLTLYLHVFIEQLLRLRFSQGTDLASKSRPSPFLFNLGRPSADLLSGFLFYALVPCTLAVFVWKAIPRPDSPWLLLFVLVVMTAVMIGLRIRRLEAGRSRPPSRHATLGQGLLWVLFGACIVAFVPLAWVTGSIFFDLLSTPPDRITEHVGSPQSTFRNTALLRFRRLQLFAAQLDKKNLNGFYAPYADLRKADFRETDLEGANLSHADLRKANLTNANLSGADLTYAHLEGAILDNARLNSADLRNATLDEFTQIALKWRIAACVANGNLTRECLGRPDLSWTDLSGANLRGSRLRGVQMTGADLSYADLSETDLTEAILRVADLRGTRLPPSIKGATVDGALTSGQAGLSRNETEATVFLVNRTSEACLEAPASPDDTSRPAMSFPCAPVTDRRYEWKVKRLQNSFFALKSLSPGKGGSAACLDGTSRNDDGAPVQMWECGDDYDNQHWRITRLAGEYVLIAKGNTGFCLHGAGTRDGSPTPLLLKCNADDHDQHWRIALPGDRSPQGVTVAGEGVRQKRVHDMELAAHRFRPSPGGFEFEIRSPYGRPSYGFGRSPYYGPRSPSAGLAAVK